MFDANMRYLPKNYKFFASVTGITKDSELFKIGIGNNSVVKCVMLDQENENPRVKFICNGNIVILKSDDEFFDTLAIYEGSITGKGFIDDVNHYKASLLGFELSEFEDE